MFTWSCALPSHVSESKMLFGYFLVTALLECFQCCLARLKSMYVHSAPGSPLSGWPAALAAWCIGCLWLEHFDVHPFGQSKFNVQLPLLRSSLLLIPANLLPHLSHAPQLQSQTFTFPFRFSLRYYIFCFCFVYVYFYFLVFFLVFFFCWFLFRCQYEHW